MRFLRGLFGANKAKEEIKENGIVGGTTNVVGSMIKRSLYIKIATVVAPIIIIIIVLFIAFLAIAYVLDHDSKIFNIDWPGEGSIITGSQLSGISDNTAYWWPIGGSEIETKNGVQFATGDPTSTIITSSFGYQEWRGRGHAGIDIGSAGSGPGVHNIIATVSGTIYSVTTGCDDNGYYGNGCGGGYGNHIIMTTSDGNYIIYGHLAQNSITVQEGETVTQGQVIGKMGNSGSSTGTHLHFQIDVGGYANSYAVDPTTYVSPDNPRPVISSSSSSQFIEFLHSWEGHGPVRTDSSGNITHYIVADDGYGTLTVGYGLTLRYDAEEFARHGVDVSTLSSGSAIEKSIVDAVEEEVIAAWRETTESFLAQNNITLEDYQVDALVSRIYNVGNINSFPSNYRTYGNTEALYENYMSKPVTSNGQYSLGLARRRAAEWELFHNGNYQLNS